MPRAKRTGRSAMKQAAKVVCKSVQKYVPNEDGISLCFNIFEKHLPEEYISKFNEFVESCDELPDTNLKEEQLLFKIYKDIKLLHDDSSSNISNECNGNDNKCSKPTVKPCEKLEVDSDLCTDIIDTLHSTTGMSEPPSDNEQNFASLRKSVDNAKTPFDMLFSEDNEDSSFEEIKQNIANIESSNIFKSQEDDKKVEINDLLDTHNSDDEQSKVTTMKDEVLESLSKKPFAMLGLCNINGKEKKKKVCRSGRKSSKDVNEAEAKDIVSQQNEQMDLKEAKIVLKRLHPEEIRNGLNFQPRASRRNR